MEKIIISGHARKQMEIRGISEIDVIAAIENGDLIFKEKNHRLGLKRYSKLKMDFDDLTVVWFYNKTDQKEVITVYWRRRGDWYG